MARTRRVRLYSADHKWSNGFSAAPRTSQDSTARGATCPPFSRTSTGAAAANSRRVASNSAASSTRGIINRLSAIGITYRESFLGWSEKQTSHAHRGLLHIPRRGNVLEGNLKGSAFPRRKRRAAGVYGEA